MPFINIDNLGVSLGGNVVLEDFSLKLQRGEIYSLIGPSGCGKSTLLKCICGIIPVDKGSIRLNNEPVDPRKHNLGYIPQYYGLLNWLKVRSNIFISQKTKKHIHSQSAQIIRQLGLEELLSRYPGTLSGGQQQRVALARAWMLNPDLLLMDEPFSALDTFTAEVSKKIFIQLWKQQKTTTLFVTHNVREAIEMGRHIVILSECPARVIEIVENPLYTTGASRSEDDFYSVEKEIYAKLNRIWNRTI